MNRSLLAGILLLISALCVTQCKKGNDRKTFTLSGSVIDETGTAISSATVKLDGQTVNVASDGKFNFRGIAQQDVYKLEATSVAYYPAYKNVENIDGSSLFAKIVMMGKSSLGTLNASTGGSIGSTGLRIIAPAGGFANNDGTAYTGKVNVAARYITQTNPNIAGLMPGGDFRATDQNGNDGGMRTYGFVATEFTDQAGNKLTPNQNVKVAVTIPAGLASPDQSPVNNWAYDPTQGKWAKPTTITQSGSEYFFPCLTLYQNIDAFIQTGTLTGTVNCTDGKPAAYVIVTIQSKYDKYEVISNENGKFRAKVEATSGSWTYTVSVAGGNSISINRVPVNSTTTADGLSTSQCSNSAPPQGGNGSGQFSYSGGSYSGLCAAVPDVYGCASGTDVAIATISGASFILYNIPQGSSGNYPFTDIQNAVNGCEFFSLMTLPNATQLASKGGTLTKTAARSFTFSCQMYDVMTNSSYTVNGGGNY
jgi:hypothetical protein